MKKYDIVIMGVSASGLKAALVAKEGRWVSGHILDYPYAS
jgi:thioredoxin reductase